MDNEKQILCYRFGLVAQPLILRADAPLHQLVTAIGLSSHDLCLSVAELYMTSAQLEALPEFQG